MKRVRPSNLSANPGLGRPFDLGGVRMPPQDDPQGRAQKLQPRRHMFGLPEAPTFYPSAAEFADPIAYIQKIRPEAELAGLCKIVPPTGWNPPFAMDTKKFRFKTRIQQLNSLEGKTRTNLNYLDQLYKFHSQQGHPLTKVPQLDHRPIDLFDLRHEVAVRGGFYKVNAEKRWAEIGRVMKYDRKTCTSMSNSLKTTYQKIILPFELYLTKHGGSIPTTPRRSTPNGTLVDESDANDALENGAASAGGMRRSKRRRSARAAVSATEDRAVSPGADGQHSTRTHQRHQSPLSTASASREDTPQMASLRSAQAIGSSETAPVSQDAAGATAPAGAAGTKVVIPEWCEVCKSGENDESMLICDGCDKGFHMYCLSPPLSAIPTNDWYCDSCVLNAGTDFGFEDGDEYTLEIFKQKCDEFKRKWFKDYYANNTAAPSRKQRSPYLYGPQMEGRVPEDVVEEEFWRLVASPYENVEVEYGADLHSAQHGSGFPTAERNPLEPYSRHPWNLTVLPFQPGSLFNHIQQDISGMMTPWIYVGMCFSTFCWHNEDHYTYSVNYMHWGDTKTWYGVPGRHATAFEDAMREAVPQLFEDQPDLLFQLVTMLSPEVLVSRGVDVVTCDQRAGEFVVTFPQSYHSGFNQGLNFNEAVNFATPDWMPFDILSVRRYQQYARNPVFSHDELLMTMFERGPEYIDEPWFQQAVAEMVTRELRDRKKVRARWLRGALREVEWEGDEDSELPEEMRQQCFKCKAFSFLSAVVCDCSPNYVSCLTHADQSCKCEGDQKVLKSRYSDDDLEAILSRCKSAESKAQIWETEYRRVMSMYSNATAASSSAPATATANTATAASNPTDDSGSARREGKEDNEHESLGAATVVDTDNQSSREGEEGSDEAGHAVVARGKQQHLADTGEKSTPMQTALSSRGQTPVSGNAADGATMRLSDLSSRPDLSLMILLLEEAQRLVLNRSSGRTLVGHSSNALALAHTAKTEASTTRSNDERVGRGRGRGRSRGGHGHHASEAPKASSPIARELVIGGMVSANGNGSGAAGEEGDHQLVLLQREIEQLISSHMDDSADSFAYGGGHNDLLILGDVRQLSRFVHKANEWCRAAQALLVCMGHVHQVAKITARRAENYEWHSGKWHQRMGTASEQKPSMAAAASTSSVVGLGVTSEGGRVIGAAEATPTERETQVKEEKRYKTDSEEDRESSSEDNDNDEEDDDYHVGGGSSRARRAKRRRFGAGSRRGGASSTAAGMARRGRRPRNSVRSASRDSRGSAGRQSATLRTPRQNTESPRVPSSHRSASYVAESTGLHSPSAAAVPTPKSAVSSPLFSNSLAAHLTRPQMIADVRRLLASEQQGKSKADYSSAPLDDSSYMFSADDLSALLRVGERLYFNSPELDVLIKWEQSVLQVEREIKGVVADEPFILAQLAHLPSNPDAWSMEIDSGQHEQKVGSIMQRIKNAKRTVSEIGLHFPAAAEMDRVERIVAWSAECRDCFLQRKLTEKSMLELLEEAQELQLDEDLAPYVRLRNVEQDTERWAKTALAIVKSDAALDLREMGKMLEKGRNMEFLPTNYQRLKDLQQAALDLQARTDRLVERTESKDLVKRPSYAEAVDLLQMCKRFGRFRPSSMDKLMAEADSANEWLSKVKHLFARSSGKSLADTLSAVQSSLRRATARLSGKAEPKVYCICLQPESGLMVECDECHEWYHARCLKLKDEEVKMSQFLCPLCRPGSKATQLQQIERFPSIHRISRMVESGRSLGLVMDELDPLVTIILEASALTREIERDLADPAAAAARDDSATDARAGSEENPRVQLLRSYLRALLGLGVDIGQSIPSALWTQLQELTNPGKTSVAAGVAGSNGASTTSQQPPAGSSSSLAASSSPKAKLSSSAMTPVDHLPNNGATTNGSQLTLPESYQEQFEELAYLIENPPLEQNEHGQGLLSAGQTFKEHEENCVCDLSGSDLHAEDRLDEPVIHCDMCQDYYHIGCVMVPAHDARIVLFNQLQRSLNAVVDAADIPEEPSRYICPNCCVKSGTMYPYGEIEFVNE